MHQERVCVGQYNVMTYTFGEGDNVLLLISGGPGLPSNYNQFRDYHESFANHGYRVVTWDQLGCGESDMPDDPTLWTLERFVKETESVCQALNLNKIHILGHSWGGVIGLEYCFAYPENVRSFILACCATSIPEVQRSCDAMKLALGPATFEMMTRRESDETTDHPEYQEVVKQFLSMHTCRRKDPPIAYGLSAENVNVKVKKEICGLQFLKWTGSLKNWDRSPDLHKLAMPILIIQGEYDWVTPEISQRAYEQFPKAELKILSDCSHLPYFEEPEAYKSAVLAFLKKIK